MADVSTGIAAASVNNRAAGDDEVAPPTGSGVTRPHAAKYRLVVQGAMDTTTEVADRLTTILSAVVGWIESMLSGALAGAMAKSVIAPGDRVKIIFQADANRRFTLRAAVKVGAKIIEASGLKGLWTGHGATLLRIMPYSAVSYTSFDQYLSLMNRLFSVSSTAGSSPSSSREDAVANNAVAARFCAGSAAGATATMAVYPLDLIRARYAAHWDTTKRYPSYYSALRSVWLEEGRSGLYSGLRPTLLGIVPYSGISFATFETLKAIVAANLGMDSAKQLSPAQTFVCGATAGLVGQSLTYPLDIVRRRMQVHPLHYRTVRGTLLDVAKTEGIVGGLFKGLSMNWIKGPVSVGISFTSRDYFKRRITTYHRQQAEEDVHQQGTSAANDPAASDPDGRLTPLARLGCGGVAGGLAKLWTLPFDRVRIMYAVGRQTLDEHMPVSVHVPKVMRTLMNDSPHMWQGSAAMMVRVVPYAAITYTCFPWYQQVAERVTYASAESHQPLANFLAGGAAASTATVMLYPVDLLHVHAAARGLETASYLQQLRLWRSSGGTRTLFRGLRPALVGIAPTSGIAFSLYHEGTRRADTDSFVARFAIGTAAGGVATVATYPLNVVRRTMQVEAVDAGIVQNLARIYRHNGLFSGLYRRMPLGWVLSPTTIGMSFAANDALLQSMSTIRRINRRVHAGLSATPDVADILPD